MEENQRLTGAQLLVRCLQNLGVKNSFGVPGESYLAVLDALHDADIQFTLCRQEGAASFAACAWGKLTGMPGICFVTRGPGATNGSIGVHSARQDSSPMILFVGQVGVNQKDREAFQEVDYRAFFGPLAKWATEIDNPERIPEVVSRAWRLALSGRLGPVVIGLPEDMLTTQTSVEPCQTLEVAEAGVDLSQAEALTRMLNEAERPLILIGGGGWKGAGKSALQRFAEFNNFPVSAIFRYHDLIDNNSPVYVGDAGVGMAVHLAEMIKNSDVILAVNARLGEAATQSWSLLEAPYARQKLIHVHASDQEIGKIYQPHLSFHANPNQFAEFLEGLQISVKNLHLRKSWMAKGHADYLSSLIAPPQNSPVDMAAVMKVLQERLEQNAILTNGAGNFAFWPNKHFCYGPRHRLLAPQSGAMGYGLPAAIAAALAYPDRQVVCFAGDGDLQMGLAELGTAVQHGANLIILVLNNGAYGTIRMHQERKYPSRVSGTNLHNPDFAAVAEAFGMKGFCVRKTEDFAGAFAEANQSKTGALLELIVSVEAIAPRRTIADLRSGG